MTIAARHLQKRPPRKDRDVTWARHHDPLRNTLTWTCFRRDHRRVLHMRQRAFDVDQVLDSPPCWVPVAIRFLHRELRDFVDEIDLQAMEEVS